MRKYVYPIILALILLSPVDLVSGQLFVKMSFGISTGGDITDSWHLDSRLYDYTLSQGEKAESGMDLALEAIYYLNQNFGLSLGFGLVSRSMSGRPGHFIPFGQDEPVDSFDLSPKLSSNMTPVYLTAVLSIPMKSLFQVNFFGGIGYYFGYVKGTKIVELYQEADNPSMIANRFLWKHESNVNGLGYHAGAGIDIDLRGDMDIFVEALYRAVDFEEFNTSNRKVASAAPVNAAGVTGENLGEKTTLFYAQKVFAVEEEKDIDYRISRLNLSGFSVRVGIKFGF